MRTAMTKKTTLFRPMDHQAQGAAVGMARLQAFGGFGLVHDMGLGKTITGLGLLEIINLSQRRPASMLVVAPKTVLGAWAADNDHYDADLLVLNKSASQNVAMLSRKLLVRDATMEKRPLIVCVNYEMAWRSPLAASLVAAKFDLVLCDESQKIKNRTAKSSKFMHKIGKHVAYKVASSGTPALETGLDWFSQAAFFDPQMFGERWVNFAARYGEERHVTRDRTKTFFTTDPQKRSEFEDLLFSRIHTATKKNCLDLPPETYVNLEFDLSPRERKAYAELVAESIADIEDEFGELGEVVAQHVLTKAVRLQQLSGGNALLEDTGELVEIGTSKLEAAMGLVDLAVDNGEKLVIFHRFTREGEQLRAALEKAKVGHVSIHGSVSQDDRAEAVKSFQNDPNVKVFVGQINAAAEGITLTASATTLFYSASFSATTFFQASQRNYRKGQDRPVTHYLLMARDTVDIEVFEALREKRKISDDLQVGGWRRFLGGRDNKG